MKLTLDEEEIKALTMALTDSIDKLSVALVETRSDESKYARLTKERAYLIVLRLRIFNCGKEME